MDPSEAAQHSEATTNRTAGFREEAKRILAAIRTDYRGPDDEKLQDLLKEIIAGVDATARKG